MRFELHINIGNDATLTYPELGHILTKVGVTIADSPTWLNNEIQEGAIDSGPIYDRNGNKVGRWDLKP